MLPEINNYILIRREVKNKKMNTIKAIVTTGVSILTAFVLFAAPAAHAVNQADIINSGDDFDFDHSASTRTDVQVDNTNISDVMQNINAHVETGGNSASRNIGSGGNSAGILTGNASVGVGLHVTGNHNDTAIAGFNSGNDVNFLDVVNTGDDAELDSRTERSTNVYVNNDNHATVNQMGDIHAMTGNNDANRNVGGAGIVSGNAEVAVGLNTNTNHNMTAIGMGGLSSLNTNGSGLNASSIVNTGDDLEGDSRSETRTRVSSSSYNRLNSYQSVYSHAESGDNDSDRGVGGGLIDTGAARFVLGSTVQGNHNMTMFGSLMDALWNMFD